MQKSAAAFAVTACFTLAVQAEAADVSTVADSSAVETVVVVGAGETRSVTTLVPANLEVLPPDGFEVVCFPVKVHRASAGWTRAVAIINDTE